MLLDDYNSRGFGLGIPSMRYNLANRRNASRRRRWLLPGFAVDELHVGVRSQ
jgi:hypothetical protein